MKTVTALPCLPGSSCWDAGLSGICWKQKPLFKTSFSEWSAVALSLVHVCVVQEENTVANMARMCLAPNAPPPSWAPVYKQPQESIQERRHLCPRQGHSSTAKHCVGEEREQRKGRIGGQPSASTCQGEDGGVRERAVTFSSK